MTEIVLIYSLFGTQEEAQAVARLMVEKRLAACANILAPATSCYWWEGKIEESNEIPVLFKSDDARQQSLIAAIAEAHSYDVPAIIALPCESVYAPYAQWLHQQMRGPA